MRGSRGSGCLLESERDKKGTRTHLVPKKKVAGVMDEGARTWAAFYNGPNTAPYPEAVLIIVIIF